MEINTLYSKLKEAGFTIGNNPVPNQYNLCPWYAYRRTVLPSRECECNEGKPRQIIVTPMSIWLNGTWHSSVEVEIVGQYDNWWKLQAYSLSYDDLLTNLDTIEARLVRAWNALGEP